MRKSELLAIKIREYERGLCDGREKFKITKRDLQGWADEAHDRVKDNHDWSCVEDTMKDMLAEIGVEIVETK